MEAVDVWNKALQGAMALPFVKVNREEFIRKELFHYCTPEEIEKAIKKTGLKTIALAGGVSANSYIRKSFENLKNQGYEIYYPEMKLCTDNAAMIASAGYYNYINGKISDLTLNAIPNLKLE